MKINPNFDLLSGPSLPVKIALKDFPIVSTSKGILAVGGWDYEPEGGLIIRDEIIQIKCNEGQGIEDCKWVEYPNKLQRGRWNHLAIPLPASYEVCNN